MAAAAAAVAARVKCRSTKEIGRCIRRGNGAGEVVCRFGSLTELMTWLMRKSPSPQLVYGSRKPTSTGVTSATKISPAAVIMSQIHMRLAFRGSIMKRSWQLCRPEDMPSISLAR